VRIELAAGSLAQHAKILAQVRHCGWGDRLPFENGFEIQQCCLDVRHKLLKIRRGRASGARQLGCLQGHDRMHETMRTCDHCAQRFDLIRVGHRFRCEPLDGSFQIGVRVLFLSELAVVTIQFRDFRDLCEVAITVIS
jgi:hypothetical protein